MAYKKLLIFLIILFVFAQGYKRYSSRQIIERSPSRFVYREYDPRGSNVELFRKRTEREYFKIKGGFADSISAPGLSALDFSLTWLRILAGVYEDASIEGDFSWLFHKLRFISAKLPPSENEFQTAMMPLFIVLGKDPAGALFLLNEKLSKFKTDWRNSYWAGFHALENLNERKMAGSFFIDAAKYSSAPSYLLPLGIRLVQQTEGAKEDVFRLRKFATEKLSPELLEKVKTMRPEWFKESSD